MKQWRQEEYVDPKLTFRTLDIYLHRRGILNALHEAVPLFSGTVLDVGCGWMPYREVVLSSGAVQKYLGLDLKDRTNYRNTPDLTWDGNKIPLPDCSVDCAIATEVMEHCPEPLAVLDEICRVLTPGGVLFFTVTFLWPMHDVPHDHFRYTPFSLKRLLLDAGFMDIRLHPLGGWDESLAQMVGLYLRRRPMPEVVRSIASLLALPLIYLLIRLTTRERQFSQTPMFTGISGMARKGS